MSRLLPTLGSWKPESAVADAYPLLPRPWMLIWNSCGVPGELQLTHHRASGVPIRVSVGSLNFCAFTSDACQAFESHVSASALQLSSNRTIAVSRGEQGQK